MKVSISIPFHRPIFIGDEHTKLKQVIADGTWIKESEEVKIFFKKYYSEGTCFLTNSCSSALEMCVRALGIGEGDEVIIPGFGYVAVANAVVNNGARPIFVDVNLFDGNIDSEKASKYITAKTKAIIAIHYAGRAFDISGLLKVCEQKNIFLVEDAAQSMGSYVDEKPLGSFGHLACLSFDYMKNITCGQGGLIIVNDSALLTKIHSVYDNGTNRQALIEGSQINFDWLSKGNNCQINPLASHFLAVQLNSYKKLTDSRVHKWNLYYELLEPLQRSGKLTLPVNKSNHNGHIFYLITSSENERAELRSFLKENSIASEQHYSSLTESSFGKQFADSNISLFNSEILCNQLLRLPLWNYISNEEIHFVASVIKSFYSK